MASASAVVGTGIAAGSASAATPPAPVAPTATDSLSAPGATVDAQGNLSAAPDVRATVAYNVAPGITTAGAPGSQLSAATIDCGNKLQGTLSLLPSSPSGAVSGSVVCTYPSVGTYTVKLTATDNQTPGATTVVTHTVTVAYPAKVAVDRYDGATRYGTGVALSQAEFPTAGSAGAVVLARGDVFADALAGIPLAKYKNAPLLLTPGGPTATTLDKNVESEILRVLPKDKSHTVFILGGTSAIPQAVADHISSLGYNVVRLSGDSRYGTALAIAQDPRALNNPATIVVARGDDFADALAAGPYASNIAADHGVPAAIVLSDGPSTTATLDPATKAYVIDKLASYQPANLIPTVTAIGGGADTAVDNLQGVNKAGLNAIEGNDRYETAADVAARGWGNGSIIWSTTDGLASGSSFPDALTGGAFMAMKNGPLLLTNPATTLSGFSASVLHNRPLLAEISIFGGTSVLQPSLVTAVGQAVQPKPVVYTDHHLMY
ncbi:cell wall-binding repeat-containing protein [Catenulispora sp. GP43]|uniref:cell wall-binding repeat-containing protein n=1 Tax=Catenulispora sp. GP43 TaxID=3156263 RepID=UPI0035171F74